MCFRLQYVVTACSILCFTHNKCGQNPSAIDKSEIGLVQKKEYRAIPPTTGPPAETSTGTAPPGKRRGDDEIRCARTGRKVSGRVCDRVSVVCDGFGAVASIRIHALFI